MHLVRQVDSHQVLGYPVMSTIPSSSLLRVTRNTALIKNAPSDDNELYKVLYS